MLYKDKTRDMIFASMADVIPEGKKGTATISYVTLKAEHVALANMRILRDAGALFRLEAGTYCRLHINKRLYMSDTPMEQRTNLDFVRNAEGKVLIAGLGIGLIVFPLLLNEAVTSVRVIEQNQDVIDLVGPHLEHEKLEIVQADIFDYKPAKGEKFDHIYFDIWQEIDTDNLDQMAVLHRKFKNYKNRENDQSTMSSWLWDFLKKKRRREQRERNYNGFGWMRNR